MAANFGSIVDSQNVPYAIDCLAPINIGSATRIHFLTSSRSWNIEKLTFLSHHFKSPRWPQNAFPVKTASYWSAMAEIIRAYLNILRHWPLWRHFHSRKFGLDWLINVGIGPIAGFQLMTSFNPIDSVIETQHFISYIIYGQEWYSKAWSG